MTTSKTITIEPGVEFRSVVADANVLWRVLRPQGRGAWLCEAVNEPVEFDGRTYDDDFAGEQRPFLTADIRARVATAMHFDSMMDEHARWWAAQPVGSVVHYDNSFGQFVRGVIVDVEGTHKMLAQALVHNPNRERGGWSEFDLPHWTFDGEADMGWIGRHEGDRAIMQPNVSCMYEAQLAKGKATGGDPRPWPPVPVDLPPRDSIEVEAQRLCRIRNEAVAILEDTPDDPTHHSHWQALIRRAIVKLQEA